MTYDRSMSGGGAAAPDPERRTDGRRPQSGASAGQPASPPHTDEVASAPAPPGSGQPPVGANRGSPRGAEQPPHTDEARSLDPHADFLVTSTEREAVEARLRQAVADEALTLEEFGDRMRALLAARTRGDLQMVVEGVPTAAEPLERTRERGVARPAREQGFIMAIMGGSETRGRWRPAPNTTALAVMGGTVVDLQGAEFDGEVLTISAVAVMGAVEIVVPEGVEVDVRGFAIMGGRDNTTHAHGAVLPDAPLVRVDAYAVMGGVDIRHPNARDLRYVDGRRDAFADRVPLRSADHRHTADRHDTHQSGQRRVPWRRSSAFATVRRWAAGLLAAAAIALPLGWVLSSDDVVPAVFGGNEHIVNTQALEAGDEMTVGAPVAFGGVSIQVPEGVRVEKDGVVIFGGSECAACADQVAADAPTVRVRTLGAFGGVEIVRPGTPPT